MGLTDQDWIGSAVSLTCDDELGVFQGLIKKISADEITIVRAFRNGVPLRKQNAEVVLRCSDIKSINLIEPVKDTEATTPTVINKPTPVKLPHFSNILGKQQQQQLQLQQQKQQQDREQELASTPKLKSNDNANGTKKAGVAAPDRINSTLSVKMHQLMLSNNPNAGNGMRRTPQSSRASSAQQPQMATTPNSVAAFFGNMIPAKVEVKLGSTVFNAGSSYGGGSGNNLESNCSSSADGSCASGEAARGSKPIDIISNSTANGNGGSYSQSATSYGNGKRNGNGFNNGNGNGNANGNGSGTGSFNANSYNGNSNGYSNGNGKNKQRNRVRRESSARYQQQQTFGSEADDPLLHEEFDFEGNLALFDKQAIWDDIESTHMKPDVVRHAVHVQKQQKQQQEKNYRHDENILASKPLQLRQIESIFDGSKDFVTDDGLIIPTIPAYVRNRIELSAERAGLSLQRQIDMLARGASDLAITLLGGARRLTPANNHQWPKIVIICDGVNNMRTINIGAATGRVLASHGLTVLLYVEQAQLIEQNTSSLEVSLFKATDNKIVHSVDALSTPDLVILSTNTVNLSDAIKTWLSINRASVLAIDPPQCGIKDVAIKYSILPILPLIQETNSSAPEEPETETAKISTNNCGKLYLCNLGIPDKFYRDCGIKYKSPYGHKYVIPIHSKD